MAEDNNKPASCSLKGTMQENNLRRGRILFTYLHFHSEIEYTYLYYFHAPDIYLLKYRFDPESVFILNGQWREAADIDEQTPLIVEVSKGQILLSNNSNLSLISQCLKIE